jgi:hypothetical protein
MTGDPDPHDVAAALRVSIGLLLRQMRQVRVAGELTVPETSALARLDRGGPATSSALARLEQISPQSMGATLSALEARTGQFARALSAGFTLDELNQLMAAAPLLERLAQSL